MEYLISLILAIPIGIIIWLFISYIFYRIGKKLNNKNGFWSYVIPLYDIYLLCKGAKVSGWITLGVLIPYVGIVFVGYLFGMIAKRLGKEPWLWGIIIALFSIPAIILAFDSSKVIDEDIQESEDKDIDNKSQRNISNKKFVDDFKPIDETNLEKEINISNLNIGSNRISEKDNLNALKVGYKLKEYEIIEVLGIGGFGITYLARDKNLNKKVVLKEYFPNELVVREANTTVIPNSVKSKEFYTKGLDRFLQEAKTLAKFKHPNIVHISRFIDDENHTAYFVMDYEEGEDLEEILNRINRSLSEEEILNIIMPILDGLKTVHKEGIFHRDIKPANIFIRKNSTSMLIDFGAAREEFRSKTRNFSSLNPHTPEYAPFEQISGDVSKIGAFSDIYSIGAILYRLIMGKTPIKAIDRSHALLEGEADPYESAYEKLKGKYSDNLLKAIDWALSFKTKDRPQSVQEFQKALYSNEKENSINKSNDTKKNNSSDKIFNSILILIVIVIIMGVYYFNVRKNNSAIQNTNQIKPKEKTNITTNNNDNFTFEIKSEGKYVKLGEKMKFLVEFKRKKSVDVLNLEFKQFTFSDFLIQQNGKEDSFIKGDYVIHKLNYYLFPLKKGEVKINPLKIKVTTTRKEKDENGFWIKKPFLKTLFSNSLDFMVENYKSPKEFYLMGKEYEKNREIKKAKAMYQIVLNNFENSDIALKAKDRLLKINE